MDTRKKLISLATEKGFESVFVEKSMYYFWLCELHQWLREEKQISVKVDDFYQGGKIKYDFNISRLGSQDDNPQGIFKTYEEALEEGLYETMLRLDRTIVSRAINGIPLNGKEYLLDPKKGEYMTFKDKREAIQYLRDTDYSGYTEQEFEEQFNFETL